MSSVVFETEIQSDDILVERVCAGDRNAFGDLIHRHHAACINIATGILRDRTEAEDEVQKAYWNAFSRIDQYRTGPTDRNRNFLAWLLRIVKNQCLMLIRVRRRMPLLRIDINRSFEWRPPIDLPAQTVDAEQGFLDHEMAELLQKEIRRIPPLLRTVLQLYDMEERSMPDVAQQLQITVPAAKSRLLRARRELRNRVIVHCPSSRIH